MKFTSDNKKVKQALMKVYKNLRAAHYSLPEINNWIENNMKIHTLKLNGLVSESERIKRQYSK
jgi:hypothetical protein